MEHYITPEEDARALAQGDVTTECDDPYCGRSDCDGDHELQRRWCGSCPFQSWVRGELLTVDAVCCGGDRAGA